MTNPATRSRIIALLGCAFFAGSLTALESDREQPLQFSSLGNVTTSIVNDLRIVEMSDEVQITQGTMEVTGDEAIFEYDASSGELRRITVSGAPVRYSQQLNTAGNQVLGRSDTLLFYTDASSGETIIELVGNAEIQDSEAAWRCESITYIVEQELIPRSTGPCEGLMNGIAQ